MKVRAIVSKLRVIVMRDEVSISQGQCAREIVKLKSTVRYEDIGSR
jgi:hypothetical protein